MDNKNYIINHLKHKVERSEKDIERWRNEGITNMLNYEKGIKTGLEIAIHWLEIQEE